MKAREIFEKIKITRRRCVPLPAFVSFCFVPVAAVIYIIMRKSTAVADFFNDCVSPVFRNILTGISNIFPLSIVEILILASPVLIALLFIMIYKNARANNGKNIKILWVLTGLISYLLVSFVLVFAPAYFATPIEVKAGFDTSDLTVEKLKNTFSAITDEINELCQNNDFPTLETGATEMPYTFGETVDKIELSYEELRGEYPFLQRLKTTAKPILLSPLMTYTHISGIYTYYTGEANINTNYPDYIVVSSIAHEMAHQRGVAREDEANFVSFLVLSNSEDPYLRYSALLDVYSTVGNALYDADKDSYTELRRLLNGKANSELAAYSEFFDKYRDSTASEISGAVNDAYLQSQGTEGVVAYDLVTELVVAYYSKNQ